MKNKWDFYSLFYNPLLSLVAKARSDLYQDLQLDITQPLRIYVAGCGTGLDFPYFPAQSQITGVDCSTQMLAKCQQQTHSLLLPPHNFTIDLIQGKAEKSTLPDNSQDLVILHLILAVTDNPQGLLHEACRVVKNHGRISIWDKFLPEHQQASCLRRGINVLTKRLGTSINLQIDPLLHTLPLHIQQRKYRFGNLMQHIVLKKQVLIDCEE